VNPYDEWYALVRALEIKEAGGGQVTIITVGGATDDAIIRKALAIGADAAIRVNAAATDGLFVAKQLAEVVKNGEYDLVLTGRESIDYNGGMVPGMLASLVDFNFVNGCVGIEVDGTEVSLVREIDGGNETHASTLPMVVAGQKGIVEESDLRIPNMRGIMMARKKPLTVVEPFELEHATAAKYYEKPATKGAVKLIDADNIDALIDLLHNEAKVI